MFEPKFLEELTTLVKKYEHKPNTTMFLISCDHDTELFTGTPIYGKHFSGKYDIQECM